MQSAIARKSKLSPYKLSMVLNKQRKLDANELFDVCDAIDMTPTELREYKPTTPERRQGIANALEVEPNELYGIKSQ